MTDTDRTAANDLTYCHLCMDTGRVRGLDETGAATVDPCVLCHPDRLAAKLERSR